jgi:hypothetical protein
MEVDRDGRPHQVHLDPREPLDGLPAVVDRHQGAGHSGLDAVAQYPHLRCCQPDAGNRHWYFLPLKVTVRSDNGAQFEAKMVRECLSEMEIQQEFSHVATPQDDGHIEFYHAAHRHHIVKKAVCNVYEFSDLG